MFLLTFGHVHQSYYWSRKEARLRDVKRCLSDTELVARCLNGDRKAFAAIVEKYAEAVRAVAYSYTRDLSDVDDVAQSAFLSALSSLHRLRDPSKLSGWLGRITSNLCIDWLHARNREVPLDGTQLSGIRSEDLPRQPTEPPVDAVLATERREQVLRAIDRLPDDYRTAVLLRYWSNLSYEGIASFLDVPMSTVKGRLYKAKRLLRSKLKCYVEEREKIEG